MIQTIILRNFQGHKNTVIDLSDGITAITGRSDSGKSSVIRALYWLAFGLPKRNDFKNRHVKAKTCSVTAITDEGVVVKRVKGEGINKYMVGDQVFTGFGLAVPEPVTDALNLSTLNFLRQRDSSFLFSNTGGEVASYLNTLVDLDIIGTSLQNISAEEKQMVKTVKEEKTKLVMLREQLNEFDWIDDAEVLCTQAEVIKDNIEKLTVKRQKIAQHVSAYQKAMEISKTVHYDDDWLPALQRIFDMETNINKLYDKENQIQTALTNYENSVLLSRKCIANYNASVQQYNKVKPKTCPLCGQKWS